MTNKNTVGETEAEAFQKVEQQPASEEAQSLPQQSTDGYRPTERNYQNNLFVNPSPSAPNQTLLDILGMMQTDAELALRNYSLEIENGIDAETRVGVRQFVDYNRSFWLE
ncbi:hypothetical protein DAPPUDRAFT_106647 [Daphnia pulex]|uniref:Uncharacterized protein n=1 Tax=Daphnia pulex TaxID=6669 RepID=E9GUK7_DAPPU|nr:hypothetical protein DAPPUDRAFT_106647 [Daphnia pulex]|eukprot:EFX76743.1 hypothetical protein DAPPUDRAFT_106647 [Daphnia pulex]